MWVQRKGTFISYRSLLEREKRKAESKRERRWKRDKEDVSERKKDRFLTSDSWKQPDHEFSDDMKYETVQEGKL